MGGQWGTMGDNGGCHGVSGEFNGKSGGQCVVKGCSSGVKEELEKGENGRGRPNYYPFPYVPS